MTTSIDTNPFWGFTFIFGAIILGLLLGELGARWGITKARTTR